MYTKKQCGEELKEKISQKISIQKIGEWAHSKYIENILDIDKDLRGFLLDLNTMVLGQEFAYSYEELESFANRLIADEDVKL